VKGALIGPGELEMSFPPAIHGFRATLYLLTTAFTGIFFIGFAIPSKILANEKDESDWALDNGENFTKFISGHNAKNARNRSRQLDDV
jgi:hypothetical protein